MKKLLSIILAVALMLCALPLGAFTLTASAATEGYYTYEISNDAATITDVDESISGDITIPSTLGGYPVTSIGNHAFSGCSNLTGINIPYGVTSIVNEAFYYCSSLTNIHIPDSVTSIGDGAFYYCSSLNSIDIPESVTNIGSHAIEGTAYYNDQSNWQNGSLYIDNHLIEVHYSFSGAYNVNEGTKTISGSAFFYCENLTSVTIPDSVTSIGEYAFGAALGTSSSLTAIYVDSENQYYYSQDGVLFNKNKTKLIRCPFGKKGEYTIPDCVTNIESNAFSGCIALKKIIIPNSVISIGRQAFVQCLALDSITIPNSVTSIGDSTFAYCICLKSIVIPDSVTNIGKMVFTTCSSLTDVYYTGSKTEADKINIGLYNDELKNATWHYNTCNADGHVYDNACDTTCNICGAIRTITHSYETVWSSNVAEHWHKCSVCGAKKDIENHSNNGLCVCTICAAECEHDWAGGECSICGKKQYAPGDANGDGRINNKDLGLLMQKLNGWSVEISDAVADINADGKVNNKDYGLLMQYVNGWDVEIG